MLVLRYAALVAAALWVGGLVILAAVAAPSIFDTIAARGVSDGRAVAGAVFGEALRRFHLLTYALAAVIIGSLLLRGALGPRPAYWAIRLGIAALMLAASMSSGIVLAERIERARADAGGTPSALAPGDPRRVTFGRLHALATLLQIVPVAGGLALLFRELTD